MGLSFDKLDEIDGLIQYEETVLKVRLAQSEEYFLRSVELKKGISEVISLGCAHEIQKSVEGISRLLDRLTLLVVGKKSDRVYFPICEKENKFKKFLADCVITDKDIVDFLKTHQPFLLEENVWLSIFRYFGRKQGHNESIYLKKIINDSTYNFDGFITVSGSNSVIKNCVFSNPGGSVFVENFSSSEKEISLHQTVLGNGVTKVSYAYSYYSLYAGKEVDIVDIVKKSINLSKNYSTLIRSKQYENN